MALNSSITSTSLCDLGKYHRYLRLAPVSSPPPPAGAVFNSLFFSFFVMLLYTPVSASYKLLLCEVFPELQISGDPAHMTNADPHTLLSNLLHSIIIANLFLNLSELYHLIYAAGQCTIMTSLTNIVTIANARNILCVKLYKHILSDGHKTLLES